MIPPRLTDVATIKSILAKHGAAAKRSLGQNFLISPEVVEATLAILADGPQNITELGAGLGTLTQALAASGFSVRAIEKDDVLVELARRHAPGANLVHGDLKDVPWTWDTPFQLVGNIPYNLTGLIIRRVTQLVPKPTQALFLVQSEVAGRILAKPPNMSLISLAVQLWGNAYHALHVPRNCFWPQPKVNSALILLVPKNPPLDKGELEGVMTLAKICFQGKRKQIGGSLKKSGTYAPEHIEAALTVVGIVPTARPQELAADSWRALWRALTPQA